MEEKQVYNLDDVEIFETGKWNGDNYSTQDLDDMVQAFTDTKGALKPHLKLGHSHNQELLQKDGFPSAGWITELKRNGNKLLAKIENIPDKIHGLLKNKAYGRVSSEIFWNLKLNGKKHRRALKAVALLGADTPEVHSLDDFINLYTENFEGDLKIYNNKEDNMADENKLQELEGQLKEYDKKFSDIEEKYSSVLKENEELKSYAAKAEYDKKESEIKSYLAGQVKEGKITPAQVDYFTALALDDKEIKTYTNDESVKVEGTGFDMVKGIIENSSKQVDFTESSEHKKTEKKVSQDDELYNKVTEYSKEHKISYNEAFEIIAMEVN